MWSLTYRDGSANAYRFRGTAAGGTYDYLPVTPAQSSTGTYSGGDPRSGALDASTAADLRRRAGALEAATALHVPDRGKGTGAFHIEDEVGTRDFLIARGAELASWDAFVAAL